MIKKFLNYSSNSTTGAAIIIAAASLINKFVGLARDRIIAHNFGIGQVTDAYYAAFKIPDFIFNLLVVGALTAGFIPIFTRLFQKEDTKKEAWEMANNILNILAVALLVLSVLGIIFSSTVAKIVGPGLNPDSHLLTARFIRIIFLSPLILGISMVFGGILQSLRHFVAYALAPIFYNLGIIFGVVILVPTLGVIGLPIGVIIGAVFHCLVQILAAKNAGWRWQRILDFKERNTLLVGKLMIPRTLGLAVSNLNGLINTMLASLLPTGAIAAYSYADNLQWVPIGVIGIPFALAVFPVLAKYAAEKDNKKFVDNLSTTARQILFLIIPLSVLLIILRAQIVRVVLGTGAFDWNATINTANTLAFLSLGLFAQALNPLMVRAFYALENTKTPFIIGVVAALSDVVFSYLLMKPLGVAGLALGTSLGVVVNLLLLTLALRKITKNLNEIELLTSVWKIALGTLLMALVTQGLKYPLANWFGLQHFWGVLAQGFIAGMTGLIVYTLVCYRLKLPELMIVKESLTRRWLKVKNLPPETETEMRN